MPIFAELKRRNVFKVGAAYLVVAWLLVQVSVAIEAPLRLPDWFDTATIVLLAIGFPLSLVLAWAFELTPEGVKLASTVDPVESIRPRTGDRLNYVIVAALSFAVAFLLVDRYVLDDLDGPGRSAEAGNPNPSAPASTAQEAAFIPNSVAILPFETLSNDEANADFAEGVYADIFYELEKLDRLTVIGRRTMKRYENTLKSYQEIAAETRAQAVLELLVRFADNRVRINAELVRVAGPTEDNIWRQAYEEVYTSSNLFEIQTDIARNIAQRLVGALSAADEARLAEVITDNTEALSYYLRALPYTDDGTQEDADNCVEPISQAVALDPEFKEAWFRKGVCHDIRGAVYPNISAEERDLAVSALERAIAVDDEYAEARRYLSSALASGGNWREAGEAYRQALDLGAPSPGPSQSGTTGFLFAIGHLRTAFESAQSQFDRDPEGPGTIGTNFRMLLHEALGDARSSDQTYQLGRGLYEPWNAGIHGRLVALMGRVKQGQIDPQVVARYFQDMYSAFGPWHMELAEHFDDREAAAAFLHTSIARSVSNPFNQVDIATHAAYFDEPELALEALRNATSFFAINVLFVWTPLFREVRQLEGSNDTCARSEWSTFGESWVGRISASPRATTIFDATERHHSGRTPRNRLRVVSNAQKSNAPNRSRRPLAALLCGWSSAAARVTLNISSPVTNLLPSPRERARRPADRRGRRHPLLVAR